MPADAATAKAFHDLHADGVLLLANAWDAGSARLVESLGGKAVATTSAGVAWAHGYPDGDLLPADLALATVASVARAVSVPVTADIEGGYSDDPKAVAEFVGRVIDAGAVGINIEDGTKPADLLCAKIEAIRAAAGRAGVDLFINARTDVYLAGLALPERRVEETLSRGARYRDAGASGLFAPGVVAVDEIEALVKGCGLPLNVLVRAGLPGAASLAKLGVRRLSTGSWIAAAALARTAELTRDFLADGASEPLYERVIGYGELNEMMGRS